MTDYHWPTIRAQLADLFHGEQPRAETEAIIIEAFKTSPTWVIAQGQTISESPGIRSHWAVLAKRMGDTPPDITVTDDADKTKRTAAALNWIENAGLYCDREQDCVEELTRPGGLLHLWVKDGDLLERVSAAWTKHRPRGAKAEAASAAYAQEYRDFRAAHPELIVKPVAYGLEPTTKGPCDDCQDEAPRWILGKFALCGHCSTLRQRAKP